MSRREGIPRVLWDYPPGYSPDGCGGLLAVLSPITQCLCCSLPCPSVGSLQGRHSSINFSKMSPSHRLQFSTSCSSMGPLQDQKPCQLLLQRGLPMGSQPPSGSSRGCRGTLASPPPATKTWPRSATEMNSRCWNSLQQNPFTPLPLVVLTWW